MKEGEQKKIWKNIFYNWCLDFKDRIKYLIPTVRVIQTGAAGAKVQYGLYVYIRVPRLFVRGLDNIRSYRKQMREDREVQTDA